MDNKPVAIDDLKDARFNRRVCSFCQKHPFGVSLTVLGFILDMYFINNKEEF